MFYSVTRIITQFYHYYVVFPVFIIAYLCKFRVFYILVICQVMYITICVILLQVHIIPMLVPCNSNCPSTMAHYHSPIKFNPKSINPLIGNNYTVYPTLKLSKFSFNNVLNHDFRFMIHSMINVILFRI